MTTATPDEVFAIDLAQLAREIAMDIFEVKDVLKLHQLSDDDWTRVQENPRFRTMLEQMVREWGSAASTRERVKIKAATGLEGKLEVLIGGLADENIPYTQRIEGAKFLARIGEIEGNFHGEGGTSPFAININIGEMPPILATARVIDAHPVIPETE